MHAYACRLNPLIINMRHNFKATIYIYSKRKVRKIELIILTATVPVMYRKSHT